MAINLLLLNRSAKLWFCSFNNAPVALRGQLSPEPFLINQWIFKWNKRPRYRTNIMNCTSFPKAVVSPNSIKISTSLCSSSSLFQNINWEFLDEPLDGVVWRRIIVNLLDTIGVCNTKTLSPRATFSQREGPNLNFIKKKIVSCLLTLMTVPVYPHLVFTLSRPHCSTS